MEDKSSGKIFCIILYALFLYPILPQYIYIVNGVNILNFMIAVVIMLYVIIRRRIYFIYFSTSIPMFWLYTFFYAIMMYKTAGFLKFATFTMLYFVFPYILIELTNSERRFFHAIDVVINAGFIMAILGIIESVLGFNFFQLFAKSGMEFFYEVRYGLLRIMGTFGQPISYGIFHVFITMLVIYRISTNDSKKEYLYLVYIMSTLNIFLSVSRTPILMYVFSSILLLYSSSKKNFLNYCLVGVVLICMGNIIFNYLGIEIPLISDLIQVIKTFSSNSDGITSNGEGIGNRLELFRWVSESMGNNWILGNGFNTPFEYEVYEWQIKTSIENHYLNIMWYMGVSGLVLLILSYINILIEANAIKWKKRKLSMENNLSFLQIASIVFISYFVGLLGVQETDTARIFTVYVTFLICYKKIGRYAETFESI